MHAGEKLALEVRETTGIRRFGYPVSTEFNLAEPVLRQTRFRLTENGKPVAAQFRRIATKEGRVARMALDFDGDFMPHESREYVVEYGLDVPAGPEPERGLKIEETDDEFRISNGPNLQWVVPRDLLGLLRSVKTPKTDYLRPDSPGLFIRRKDDSLLGVGGHEPGRVETKARIVKQGPIACTLRFDSATVLSGDQQVASSVELDFPRSKSWMRVTWTVDDPKGFVAGLGADMNLNLTGEPTLVDFGAGSLVYATLARGQAALLRAGTPPTRKREPGTPIWETLRGPRGKIEPHVHGPTKWHGQPVADGWAHVMDRERCTAVAIAEFARHTQDCIEADADGRLQVWREFASDGAAPPEGPKTLTFWLHFVGMPPHVGAVTSPQSMQSPLELEWLGRTFLGVPENRSRKIGDEHPESALRGCTKVSKVELVDYERFLDLKKEGKIVAEEVHDGFAYFAIKIGRDAAFPNGARAYFIETVRYKARLPLVPKPPNEKPSQGKSNPSGTTRNSASPGTGTVQDPRSEIVDLSARAKAVLSKTSGELRIAGLKAPVEVLRDKWGIPHIFAQNSDDLFFAQGFVQAQDRLWQMEIWRRTTEGRLAEIVGPAAVDRDRIARLMRYRGDMDAEWTSYSPDAKRIIEAFVRGVNACIENCRDNPPIEFQLTGIKPEPWTPEVCLGRMAGFIMCRNASAEVMRAQLVRELGPDEAAKLLPTDPPQKIVVPDGLDLDGIDQSIVAAMNSITAPITIPLLSDDHAMRSFLPGSDATPLVARVPSLGFSSEGSNNWTVSGRLTNTGKPILANDPHRPVVLPSLRYVVHLVCPPSGSDRGWNVIGGTEPALPGVTIGHNDRVAWGMTIVGTDQQDLYVEDTHSDDPNRYRVGDEWQPILVEREQLRVRGESEPRTLELKFTRHGPVIFEDPKRHRAYALCWAGLEPGTAGYLGALALDRARNWPEFLDAAARWKLPSENLVYADVDGHIGWIAAALTPVRRAGNGLLLVPGASGQYDWIGWLPTSELPQRFDPPKGYIATANHNILPLGYRHTLGFEWAAPFRIQRIDEVFCAKADGKFSIADFEALQHDSTSIPARRLLAVLRDVLMSDDAARRGADMLLRWNAVLSRDSAAAALYEVWQSKLSERVLKTRVPENLWGQYSNRLPLQAMIRLVENPDAAFGADSRAGRDDAVLGALRDAVSEIEKRLGPDPTEWQWGKLHQAHFKHMLATTPATQAVFDLAPVPRDGDGFTPIATAGPNFTQATGASFREIIDLADWDRSVGTSVPGQSGQPGSPHYADLLPLWAEGRYHPWPFSRAAVEAATLEPLVLRPRSP